MQIHQNMEVEIFMILKHTSHYIKENKKDFLKIIVINWETMPIKLCIFAGTSVTEK